MSGEVVLKGDSSLDGNIVTHIDTELEDNVQPSESVNTDNNVPLKNHSVIGGDTIADGKVELSEGSLVNGAIHFFSNVPPIPTITSLQFALTTDTQNI